MKCCHRSPSYIGLSRLSVSGYMDGENRCCIGEKQQQPQTRKKIKKKRRSSKVRILLPSPTTPGVAVCAEWKEKEEESERGWGGGDLSLFQKEEEREREKERKSESQLGTERQLLPRQRPSRTSCVVRLNRPADSFGSLFVRAPLPIFKKKKKSCVLLRCSVRVFFFFSSFNLTIRGCVCVLVCIVVFSPLYIDSPTWFLIPVQLIWIDRFDLISKKEIKTKKNITRWQIFSDNTHTKRKENSLIDRWKKFGIELIHLPSTFPTNE